MIGRVLVMLLSAGLGLGPSSALAGWSYVETTRTKGGVEASSMRSHVRTEGDHTRIDFLEGADATAGPFGAGSYLLIRNSGSTHSMVIVSPTRRSFGRLDPETMMRGVGGPRMEIRDARMETLLEEPGERILGHATRHYRYRTQFTQTMDVGMGSPLETKVEDVEDVWVAPGIDPGAAGNANPFGSGGSMTPLFGALQELEAQKARGFALRRRSVTTTRMTGGPTFMGGPAEDRTITESEVTDLRRESLDAALFEIPSGYTESRSSMMGVPILPPPGGEGLQ